jgi:natural product biosynthesis luciferase-like monooxygenase protein
MGFGGARNRTASFVGDGSLLISCAEIFVAAGHTVAGISTRSPSNREWARSRGLRFLGTPSELDLGDLEIDYLFSVANLEILPGTVLRAPRRFAINFHDGPLPRYAGLNAPAWALMNGESTYGITWHEMTPGVDGGRILWQTHFAIAPDETAYSLNTKCYAAAAEAFATLVNDLTNDRLLLTEQTGEPSRFSGSRRPQRYGFIDFTRGAEDIARLVRALDYGAYDHPLGHAKLWTGDSVLAVAKAVAESTTEGARPGTVLSALDGTIRIATGRGAVTVSGLTDMDGSPVASVRLPAQGSVLRTFSPETTAAIDERLPKIAAGQARWNAALANAAPFEIPYPQRCDPAKEAGVTTVDLAAISASETGLVAGFAAWAALVARQKRISLAIEGPDVLNPDLFVPLICRRDGLLTIAPDPSEDGASLTHIASGELAKLREGAPLFADAIASLGSESARERARGAFSVGVVIGSDAPAPRRLTLQIDEGAARLHVCARAFTPAVAKVMAGHLAAFLNAFLAGPAQPIRTMPLVPETEHSVFDRLNRTECSFPTGSRIDLEMATQAARTPERIAIECGEVKLTYGELEARSAALAEALRTKEVGPGHIVGLVVRRSAELPVALLGILKSGAAYLPLDPDYPRERTGFIIADSGAQLFVADRESAQRLGLGAARTIVVEDVAEKPRAALPPAGTSSDLAYLIYTSGSTGKPKGVMVTHRNVLNFFTGMDRRLPHQEGGRFLAVTSTSFDISVLELCWTLARGFTVVLQDTGGAKSSPGFSLFFFSSDATSRGKEPYRLLTESAKFADANGFEAVWTPERHFHAFGGLFPNPAISSMAVAGLTQNVHVRAGSCVLPLHSTVRVAEDWAVIDNLSGGRTGLALASGWQPNDFVIRPEAFARRKDLVREGIDALRQLWRGGTVTLPRPDGKLAEISTLPRPLNDDIPLWVTAAGDPETYELAGAKGCHVLTHLLGQTFEEVAEKIRLYRAAWAKAGHAGRGRVTLMLHTFVGEDEARVEETVRQPMKSYLRSAVDLVRKAAWTFPTFVQKSGAQGKTPAQIFEEEELTPEEAEALLEHAFQRYYRTSGLFGTPETCAAVARKAVAIGVDEIACLIDFGVATEEVLAHLPLLKKVMDALKESPAGGAKASLAEDMLGRAITHFQCTPSMASMMVADRAGRAALGRLGAMMVGGEALPLALAKELRQLVPGRVFNMYGPTETTIWSMVHEFAEIGSFVPLGTPIANTAVHVLNGAGGECPALVPGELVIGGEGVSNGYWKRDDLTSERFVHDRRADGPRARIYRTGDVVRRHQDGAIEFLGRLDHQVKIRGHRIELGEIEAALRTHDSVREAVAVAVDGRLAAYVVPAQAGPFDVGRLKAHAAERLPEVMRPEAFVALARLPMTPNGKIDRKALPPLPGGRASATAPAQSAATDLEAAVAAIWCEALGVPLVGVTDNFFDLGGHSLLVVQVQRRIRQELGREVPIADMFRFTTVRALATYLGDGTGAKQVVRQGQARAALRNRMMGTRSKSAVEWGNGSSRLERGK